MFTGIIQQVGVVETLSPHEGGVVLTVSAPGWTYAAQPGDSIAVNGCCLTCRADVAPPRLSFDVVRQTLRMTALGDLAEGDRVNLEHAARLDTLFGGHLVQGHVDGRGEIIAYERSPQETRARVRPPSELDEFIVEKGSISIDGVSLTLADVSNGWFEVALIPTTLEKTNLGDRKVGDAVNLEVDLVAKTIVHWLRRQQPVLTP